MKNPLEEPDYVPVATKLDNLADDIRRASIMMKNWEKNGYDPISFGISVYGE